MDDDIFDAALNLEQEHAQEGFDEGLRDGREAGHAEGRVLGLQTGFELGQEVGYYRGCLQLWQQLRLRPGGEALGGERAARALAALATQLDAFPAADPQVKEELAPNERLQELMDGLRGRFKAAVAMLGLPQEAFPSPAAAMHAGQASF